MMLPRSTYGRNASCCALLKRWISSTKTIVFSPTSRSFSAWCITFLILLILLSTALKLKNLAFVCLAIISAKVVLPTPGGPQKIIEDTRSVSIISRSILPFPSNCFCPTNSSKVLGRTRLASGVLFSD